MNEQEHVQRARKLLAGSELSGRSTGVRVKEPKTRTEVNIGSAGPTHMTEFGICEHDWVMSPCTKHGDCIACSEHMYVKGNEKTYDRLKGKAEHNIAECQKALTALRAGVNVADRWLEHALKSLMRELQLLALLESEEVEDGATIRLTDDLAEHTHLRRALDQRLPQLRDRLLSGAVEELIEGISNGKALIDIARGEDRGDSGRMADAYEADVGCIDPSGR